MAHKLAAQALTIIDRVGEVGQVITDLGNLLRLDKCLNVVLDATVGDDGLQGAARLVLADGVALLDPEAAVFAAMLAGWECQQRVRGLKQQTIATWVAMVNRLALVSNQYPWQWTAGEVEAFLAHLRSGTKPVALSTLRGYECQCGCSWSM